MYAELLEMAAARMGPCREYYSLWPTSPVSEPWSTLQKAVFVAVSHIPAEAFGNDWSILL